MNINRIINSIKYTLTILFLVGLKTNIFAQSTTPTATNDFTISINTALCIIALILLFIIIILGMTLNTAIDYYKNKKAEEETKSNSSSVIKPLLLVGCIVLIQNAFSQSQLAPPVKEITNPPQMIAGLYFYGYITVIAVELLIILFFLRTIRILTGIDNFKQAKQTSNKSLWQTINQFKPLEEEHNMDTGHNYDGIRELDNITPPWFIAGFAASIIFAMVYLYRYDISHSMPSQIEEFETEVHEAKIIQDSLLKLEGNKVDENTVAMLGAADIDAGRKLFVSNCAACHGDKGQGGVGPNFTDEYWLHKGSIKDVFKSIKYGWTDKGMKAWKDDFSPTQIAQLASYVKSLKGTNPPGAKEKQGELYVEEVATVPIADSSKSK
ncbi:MAG: cbb3-type cytochrome c oxidase N-terminal domain-containing protein [Chitinophagales bacterium]